MKKILLTLSEVAIPFGCQTEEAEMSHAHQSWK